MSDKLKVLDLFAGIGGFTLGLEKTGLYETVAFCEWDKNCQMALNNHWPDVCKFDDVSDLYGYSGYVNYTYYKSGAKDGLYDLKVSREVDVITGGFPCQDISNSGSKVGISGPRSGYWKQYWRLINEIKPKGVIIENVSALRTRGLDVVLSDLNEIGYDAEWHCIPASYLGAIHKRDRIWIIAYPRSLRRENDIPLVKTLGEGQEAILHSKECLLDVVNNPFGRTNGLPEPLVRRGDDGFSRRVDRLKQVGNSVYWPIVEQLGYHLHRNIVNAAGIK